VNQSAIDGQEKAELLILPQVLLACLAAYASAGYAPAAVSYSNVYNSPSTYSRLAAAPLAYNSIQAPLAYNSLQSPLAYNSLQAPLAYSSLGGYASPLGYSAVAPLAASPLAYSAAPLGYSSYNTAYNPGYNAYNSPVLRSGLVRSVGYPNYLY
jgi:hypothetical protein